MKHNQQPIALLGRCIHLRSTEVLHPEIQHDPRNNGQNDLLEHHLQKEVRHVEPPPIEVIFLRVFVIYELVESQANKETCYEAGDQDCCNDQIELLVLAEKYR